MWETSAQNKKERTKWGSILHMAAPGMIMLFFLLLLFAIHIGMNAYHFKKREIVLERNPWLGYRWQRSQLEWELLQLTQHLSHFISKTSMTNSFGVWQRWGRHDKSCEESRGGHLRCGIRCIGNATVSSVTFLFVHHVSIHTYFINIACTIVSYCKSCTESINQLFE